MTLRSTRFALALRRRSLYSLGSLVALAAALAGCGSDDGSPEAWSGGDSGVQADAATESSADVIVAPDAAAEASVDGGPDAPPYSVPDLLTHANPSFGSEPGVIFRWRADGTSTSPGTLSAGVETIEVKRAAPFSSFRYADFHGVTTGASPGYLGDKAIQLQPQGFTVQAWFRARSVNGYRTLFSNTGSNKGISLDIADGHLLVLFTTDDGGTAYRHKITDDTTAIEPQRWYSVAVSVTKRTDDLRVAFFVDGVRTKEQAVALDHGSVLMDSPELPAVAAEPNGGVLEGEGFDGAMHAVMAYNHPLSDDVLGSPFLRDGGRYYGMPSYHDYLVVPEPAGSSSADPPYSDRRVNFARRIMLTDRDSRFHGIAKARTRIGIPLANDRYVPTGVAVAEDGKTMWLGMHYVATDGGNPDANATLLAEADLTTYRLRRVLRLSDATGAPITVPLGGLARAHGRVYATTGKQVLTFDPASAKAVAAPDPDMADAPEIHDLQASESFAVLATDAALAYDPDANALWVSAPAADEAFLDRYALTATGAIAKPSTASSDERLTPPASVRFVHGITPVALSGSSRCFLLASHDHEAVGAAKASRLNVWCEGRKYAAARIITAAGAEGLSLGPDGTLWAVSQSGAAYYQKRTKTQQWYDVLHPYVSGYDTSVLLEAVADCHKGDMTPYVGDIHSHTEYSDGIETPAVEFKKARDEVKLDFHIITDHSSQLTDAEYADCKKQALAVTKNGAFVGACGFEISIKPVGGGTLGHANILFADDFFPYPSSNSQYYDKLAACSGCVGQINHPASEKFTWDNESLATKAYQKLALCELNGATKDDALAKFHSLLAHDWRFGPSMNSDTHSNVPGNGGKRTGIFATSLDLASIKQAFEQRRTFAGNSGNGASVKLLAEECWMGARLQGYVETSFQVEARDPSVGFTKIELLGKGAKVLHTIDCNDKTVCSENVPLEVDPAWMYVVALATHTDGKFMISAPIWLDD